MRRRDNTGCEKRKRERERERERGRERELKEAGQSVYASTMCSSYATGSAA